MFEELPLDRIPREARVVIQIFGYAPSSPSGSTGALERADLPSASTTSARAQSERVSGCPHQPLQRRGCNTAACSSAAAYQHGGSLHVHSSHQSVVIRQQQQQQQPSSLGTPTRGRRPANVASAFAAIGNAGDQSSSAAASAPLRRIRLAVTAISLFDSFSYVLEQYLISSRRQLNLTCIQV